MGAAVRRGSGRRGPGRDRVAFGDDAAVAGGLVVRPSDDRAPLFVADAVADPIAGLAAAVVGTHLWSTGTVAAVDVPLVRAARWARGDRPDAVTSPSDSLTVSAPHSARR